MKKYLLTLLIAGISFIGFSNAQFISFSDGTSCSCSSDFISDCSNSSCSIDGLEQVEITSPGKWDTVQLAVYCGGSFSYKFYIQKANGPFNLSYLNKCSDFGIPSSNFKGFYCVSNCSNLSIKYSSSKMPVSELNPVINGLKSSITEFIPYVVYIGLGILGLLISFFGIRYLINWVRKKIFSSFK